MFVIINLTYGSNFASFAESPNFPDEIYLFDSEIEAYEYAEENYSDYMVIELDG